MASVIPQQAEPGTGWGVAATASPAATAAAIEILAEGGNAVDAAVAAALALCVCEPSGSGLGGHTVLLIRNATGAVAAIEGQSRAPAAAGLATISREDQRSGIRATTVASTPATLGYAHGKFGVLPPKRVFRPAIHLAEDGFVVSRLYRKQLAWTLPKLEAHQSTRTLFLRGGHLPEPGERFRQPVLAGTLRRLAGAGWQDFYRGAIAGRIVEDMERSGGLITAKDLAEAATPVEREPLSMDYRGHRILSAGSAGGANRLFAALQAMQRLWPDSRGDADALWYEALAKAGYAAASGSEPALRQEKFGETTHLCVADATGNVVALTQSIQSLFGAKVANAGLGFLYNNYLCTCPRRPHPSQLSSRCQPRSNAAPTLILQSGRPFLALGAAGSRRIVSSILQTICGVIDRGLGVREAVAAPRVHALASGRIWIEGPVASEEVVGRLAASFRDVIVKPALSFKMGAVQAIQFHGGAAVHGTADPRREGVSTSLASYRGEK